MSDVKKVKDLVAKLGKIADKSDAEARKIRRMLRQLGHKGGTGKKSAPPKRKAKK